MFFFAVLFIGLILLIIWIILTLILTSNIVYYTKKKIPTYIAFPLSAFLILFIASFFTFGWGWFVPYTLQPSYHEFKQMCELNKLPNNEEKYNKILAYFDLSLDTLDWEMLDKKMKERKPIGIIGGKEAYLTSPNQVIVANLKNNRYDIDLSFYTKDK